MKKTQALNQKGAIRVPKTKNGTQAPKLIQLVFFSNEIRVGAKQHDPLKCKVSVFYYKTIMTYENYITRCRKNQRAQIAYDYEKHVKGNMQINANRNPRRDNR